MTGQILKLFKYYGHDEYGNKLSLLSHSIQAGFMALDQGLDDELILAAFLHDIGHLVPFLDSDLFYERMDDLGIAQHDRIGSAYLAKLGFGPRVCFPVDQHVDAKRYLAYKNPDYFKNLNEAEKKRLEFQGGIMTAEQAKRFEAMPYFQESIKIRQIDDASKDANFTINNNHWIYFEVLLNRYFEHQFIKPKTAKSLCA